MFNVLNIALLVIGLALTVFGVAVGLSGSRSMGDLLIAVAVLVPGCAAAVAGYLGILIERRRKNTDV